MQAISILSSLFLQIFIFSSICLAAPPLYENFDEVTAPALPQGWASVSLQGSYSATTTSSIPLSGPNAAFIPDPGASSDTALITPLISYVMGEPTYELMVEFYHKRGMETSWDGGVLEISLNGAGFVDVTNLSIGGKFAFNGYNTTSLGLGSNLQGRPAWTGAASDYEFVRLQIPAMASGTSFQFRFRLASDFMVGAGGWRIDEFRLIPFVDTSMEVNPTSLQVNAGDEFTMNVQLLNPSSVDVFPGFAYFSLPSADSIRSVTLSSGFVMPLTDWVTNVAMPFAIPAFSSADFAVRVKTSVPHHSSAVLKVTESLDPRMQGASSGLCFVSSSPSLPVQGLINVPATMSLLDLCAPLPTPPPGFSGSVVFNQGAGACPLGKSALTAQQYGAAAYVGLPPPTPTVPAEEPTSPCVEEPPTAGLTIPVFSVEPYSFATLGGVFAGPPGSARVSLVGNNKPERSTAVFSVSQIGSNDPKLGNNFRAVGIDVVTDQDRDGTPDDQDGCRLDPAKSQPGACGCSAVDVDADSDGVIDCLEMTTDRDADGTPDGTDGCQLDPLKVAPGICGCGTPDKDVNGNGVPDCQVTKDFRADVLRLQDLVKQLKLKRFQKQRSLRTQIRTLQSSISTRAGQGGISVSSPNANLSKLGTSLNRPIGRLVRSAASFAKSKRDALKAIMAVLAVVPEN